MNDTNRNEEVKEVKEVKKEEQGTPSQSDANSLLEEFGVLSNVEYGY